MQVRLLRIRLKELLVACDVRPDKWMTYLRRLCDHFARHNTVVSTDTAAARRGGTTLGSTGSNGATLDINAFYHLVTYLKIQVNEEGLRRLFASVALLDDCRLVTTSLVSITTRFVSHRLTFFVCFQGHFCG
jgi:hypothetical protein